MIEECTCCTRYFILVIVCFDSMLSVASFGQIPASFRSLDFALLALFEKPKLLPACRIII